MNCVILSPNEKSRKAIENVIGKNNMLNVLISVPHINQAKDVLSNHKKIDIVFIEIDKPGMDGWHLLDNLNYKKPYKIFLSTKKELAVEAFNYEAVDFILLPLTAVSLLKAVGKIIKTNENIISDNLNLKVIYLKADKAIHKVELEKILYIEALADYVAIHTPAKRFIIHSTMKGILSKLPENDFIRVHKSFIVCLDMITQINKKSITIDKISIPFGKAYKKEIMKKIRPL